MAEIRVTNDGGDADPTLLAGGSGLPAGHALPGAAESVATRDVTGPANAEHPLPEGGGDAAAPPPPDPDQVRRSIEQTRARMSGTIDQIEEQLLRRKERLQEQLDVKAQVRERLAPVTERLAPVREGIHRQPLAALAGVFAASLVIGYLTGEASDPQRRRSARAAGLLADEGEWRGRAREWETQSRTLEHRNRELEAELARLRARLEDEEEWEADGDEQGGGWLAAVAGAVGGMLGRRAVESEYVVELEDDQAAASAPAARPEYAPSVPYDAGAAARRDFGTGGGDSPL